MSRTAETVRSLRAPALGLIVLLFAGLLSACGSSSGGGGGKTYVIGTSADFPPMEFRDEAHPGKFTGFEIDMMKAIMGHMGLKYKFRDMKFSGLLPAVQNGQVDMVVSDVYDTAERRKVVDFVDYFQSGLSVMVSASNGSSVTSYMDLCGKSLGIIAGSPSEQEIAQKANSDCTGAGKGGIDVQTFQAVSDELPQVDNGRLFAILEDLASLSYIQLKNPTKYKVVFQDPSVTRSGMVLKKGSSLKAKMIQGFGWYKSSGQYAKDIQKWGLPSSSMI